jgi:hypothetical protein
VSEAPRRKKADEETGQARNKLMRDTAARYKAEPSPIWFDPARLVEQP